MPELNEKPTIVAVMLVGNEATMIQQNIEYHLSIGVDAFVIFETASSDTTAQILRAYADRPEFDITLASPEQVFGPTPLELGPLSIELARIAREKFQADWILSIDADEFWYPRTASLQQILQICHGNGLSVQRRNVVRRIEHADAAIPQSRQALADVEVMAWPVPVAPEDYQRAPRLPLNLTAVGDKPVVKASLLHRFGTGGHPALAPDDSALRLAPTTDLVIVHFWFTGWARFESKVNFTRAIQSTVRRNLPPTSGWQWNRWAAQRAEAEQNIEAEYRRQFPTEAQLDRLKRLGRVSRASQVFASLAAQGQLSAEARQAADEAFTIGYALGQP